MGRSADYSNEKCAIAASLDLVGEPWTLLIIRDAFRGHCRFEQWQKSLGIARNVLAARLKRLVALGIMKARPYNQKPLRHEYRLTSRGLGLKDVIMALYAWGREHVYAPQKPILILRHKQSGTHIEPRMFCDTTGQPLHLEDLDFEYYSEAQSLADIYASDDDSKG